MTDPSFQEVNRLFVLSFEKNEHRNSHRRYIFSTHEIKYHNVMFGGRDFFDSPVTNDTKVILEKMPLVKELIDYQ